MKRSKCGPWLAALLLLAASSSPATTRLPSFPEKPADADQASWSALQAAVAAAMPSSTALVASDGATNDQFGFSVALSGTTALVGAFGKTVGSNSLQGVAYVFAFNGSTWVQQQELSASDGVAGDAFGSSVALSGNTALVASNGANSSQQGAVYVFTFNGSTWIQQQELTASDGAAFDHFGTSVALSGTTALVGASNKAISSNNSQGATYVFTFNGSTWVQQQELTTTDGTAGDGFGASVVLSSTTALVGAPIKTIGSNSLQGAAYVFTFNGSTWVQQQELTANDGAAGDDFGHSVALSGTAALVGAINKAIGSNTQQGAAYVFTFNGSTWVQQQELTASDGAGADDFGYSVALAGTTALVGAFNETIGPNSNQGAAYVFVDNGGNWVQQQKLTASDAAAGDEFGYSLALSGTTALVGARLKAIGSNNYQGAAYVFYPVSKTIFRGGFESDGISVQPPSLDFGLSACGATAAQQTLMIANTGSSTVTFNAQLTSGAAFYTLSAAGAIVAPGDTFELAVFPYAIPTTSLTTDDHYAGEVTLSTDIPGDTQHIVPLHQTAQGARLTVNTTALPFGSVTVGTSANLPFVLTNSGNATANISYIGFSTPPFSISPNLVPVLGGSFLDTTVTFAPEQSGSVTGQTVSTMTSDVLCLPLPAAIPLSGTGAP